MEPMDESVLGPFSKKEVERSTLGPFAPGVQPGQPTESPPMLEAMGISPAEFKSLLDANPDAKAMLTQPEAENLYAYLHSSQKYDVHVLNNLFAELAAGMKSRLAAAKRPFEAGRPPSRRRTSPGSPGWPYGSSGPGVATVSPLGPETGPTEQGESSNQAPVQWWMEGGKT